MFLDSLDRWVLVKDKKENCFCGIIFSSDVPMTNKPIHLGCALSIYKGKYIPLEVDVNTTYIGLMEWPLSYIILPEYEFIVRLNRLEGDYLEYNMKTENIDKFHKTLKSNKENITDSIL